MTDIAEGRIEQVSEMPAMPFSQAVDWEEEGDHETHIPAASEDSAEGGLQQPAPGASAPSMGGPARGQDESLHASASPTDDSHGGQKLRPTCMSRRGWGRFWQAVAHTDEPQSLWSASSVSGDILRLHGAVLDAESALRWSIFQSTLWLAMGSALWKQNRSLSTSLMSTSEHRAMGTPRKRDTP